MRNESVDLYGLRSMKSFIEKRLGRIVFQAGERKGSRVTRKRAWQYCRIPADRWAIGKWRWIGTWHLCKSSRWSRAMRVNGNKWSRKGARGLLTRMVVAAAAATTTMRSRRYMGKWPRL